MAKTIKHNVVLQTILGILFFLPIATTDAQQLPPPAYQLAAKNAGIPALVLYAIALTESGLRIDRKIRPWPWTLNVAGKGHFFKTEKDACYALNKALKTTLAKRIDVGVAQINYGYHGQKVKNPCELLDPYLNLLIAADILKSHHRMNEDWLMTMGRYHSPGNKKYAARYQKKAGVHLKHLTEHN